MEAGSSCSRESVPVSPVLIDPAYEFAAPHYFDFTNADKEDDSSADTWFNTQASCKDSRQNREEQQMTSTSAKTSVLKELPAAACTPPRKGPVTRALAKKYAAAGATSVPVPDAGRGGITSSTKSKEASSVRHRGGVQGGGGAADGTTATKHRAPVRIFSFSNSSGSNRGPMVFEAKATPGLKRCKGTKIKKRTMNREGSKTQRKEVTAARGVASEKTGGDCQGQDAAADGAEEVVTKRQYSDFGWTSDGTHNAYLTVPKSPKFATNRRVKQRGSKTKTSEDILLEKAKSQQVQAQKRRKLGEGKLREILMPRPVLPVRSTVALTIPEEIHLHTEERLRTACQDGATSLSRDGQEEYVPIAEAVLRFQRKTPDRFHTRPHNQDFPILSDVREPPSVTQPREPVLETALRSRPVRVKSSAEIEEEMLANMPKFKARPFDRSIVERGGELGVPVIRRPPPTEPQVAGDQTKSKNLELTIPIAPNLQTMARARPSTLKTTEEMELEEINNAPKFKARPLNRNVLQGVGDLGLPVVPKKPKTIPEEFHLATEQRARLHTSCSAVSCSPGKSIRSDHSYDLRLRGLPPHPEEPFQLETEERGARKKAELLQRLEQEQKREEAMRVPKAQPLPDYVDVGNGVVPRKPPVKEPTKPEPFKLQSAVLHETAVQKRELMLAEQQKEDMERAIFKAKPVLKEYRAFQVERSRKPLTVIQEPQLLVDGRAVERQKFNSMVEAKQRDAKRSRDEYEAQIKEEEIRIIQELRRTEMIPKARPMPVYPPPVQPARSTKELTRPVSPQFARRPTTCMR